jgi:hypothetical protein
LTIAIAHQLEMGRPAVAATVLATTVCTYLHPYWRTCCLEAVRRYVDDRFAQEHLAA